MKRLSLLTICLLLLLIIFRDNVLIIFNNVYNLMFVRNDYKDAEIRLLEEKVRYLESEYDELNDFKESMSLYASYNYLVTRVIFRENYFYDAEIIIEKGSNDGIKSGMAVVNEDGLVGIVTDVLNETSKIKILYNIDNLSVDVNGVYGKLVYENGNLMIKDISRDVVINLNDEVYTAGLGNIKEKLYIGKVSNVKDGVIEKEIIIESKVDFNNLNYLIVVGDLWFFIYLIFL